MAFNSLPFLIFLPGVFLAWLASPLRWRWAVLLAASVGFYAWLLAPYLLGSLALVTIIAWSAGRGLAAPASHRWRQFAFWAAVGSITIVLLAMKYGGAALGAFPSIRESFTELGLPATITTIGVSYFSFQAISYLADVYLGVQEPEQRLGQFALYLAFFPKLLQGPIERARDLLPQLHAGTRFDYEDARAGLLRIGWGLFQKVVIADRLATHVDPIFSNVHGHHGAALIVATWLYALQLFYDFAGYTDMALGTARLFGIRLTQNFDRPYLSGSIAEFWRRWHVSFSRWLFDYIFRPLQFHWRDAGRAGTAAALVATFLLSGMWHGAKLGFVVWGLLHGAYLVVALFTKPAEKRLRQVLGPSAKRWLEPLEVVVTFQLVCFAWIFFRSDTLSDAWYVVTNLVSAAEWPSSGAMRDGALVATMTFAPLFLPALGRVTLEGVLRLRPWARWAVYYALVVGVLLLRMPGEATQFVYFKF